MDIEYKRVSENCRLFLECYWDKKGHLYFRSWRYIMALSPILVRAAYVGHGKKLPLNGFTDSPTKKVDFDYGYWEIEKNSWLLKKWKETKKRNKFLWAKSFLIKLNKDIYVEVIQELERLRQYDIKDKKTLGTEYFEREHFSEPLFSKRNEPAYIREAERASLRRIKDDFEKWFCVHDIDPLRIEEQIQNDENEIAKGTNQKKIPLKRKSKNTKKELKDWTKRLQDLAQYYRDACVEPINIFSFQNIAADAAIAKYSYKNKKIKKSTFLQYMKQSTPSKNLNNDEIMTIVKKE
jgi:hypothetical protein